MYKMVTSQRGSIEESLNSSSRNRIRQTDRIHVWYIHLYKLYTFGWFLWYSCRSIIYQSHGSVMGNMIHVFLLIHGKWNHEDFVQNNTLIHWPLTKICMEPKTWRNLEDDVLLHWNTWTTQLNGENSGKITLLGTNISLSKAVLKMSFLFPRWDMLIPWRVPSLFSLPLSVLTS